MVFSSLGWVDQLLVAQAQDTCCAPPKPRRKVQTQLRSWGRTRMENYYLGQRCPTESKASGAIITTALPSKEIYWAPGQ